MRLYPINKRSGRSNSTVVNKRFYGHIVAFGFHLNLSVRKITNKANNTKFLRPSFNKITKPDTLNTPTYNNTLAYHSY